MTRPRIAFAPVMFACPRTLRVHALAPKEQAERVELQTDADQTLAELKQADASLEQVLDDSAGYAVFPTIGKGGLIIGGGYGRGTLYEDGRDHRLHRHDASRHRCADRRADVHGADRLPDARRR